MYPTMIYKNFSGQNDTSSADSLLSTELITAQNLTFDNRGGYSKGWGRVRVTEDAFDVNPIKRLMPLYRKDGTVKKFYASGTTVWVDNGDDTYTAVVTSAGATAVFTNTDFDFFSWNDDKLYLVNGSDYQTIYYSTGNSRWEVVSVIPKAGADLTGVKRCNMHEFFSGWFRHFYAGDTADRAALWYSEDNDPTNILSGAADTQKVYPTSNLGHITGLKVWRDNVLVGYKRGWFRWYGGGINPAISADWHQVKASSGPTSNRAIVPVRELLAYTAEDGVYLLQSVDVSAEDNSRKISKDIDTTYKTLIRKDAMTAVFDGRWLIIGACNTGTVNNIALVADFDIIDEDGNPAWSIFTACYVNDLMLLDGVIYFGHSNNGLVMKFDSTDYNNDGAALPMKAEHYLTLPDRNGVLNPFALHKIKSILIGGPAVGTIAVTVTIEYIDKTYTIDMAESLVWGRDWGETWGASDFVGKKGRVGKKARRIKVTIENNVVDETFSLNALGIEYRPGKTKGVTSGVVST